LNDAPIPTIAREANCADYCRQARDRRLIDPMVAGKTISVLAPAEQKTLNALFKLLAGL
jgi:hypothetical protein